jgi:hypothetical protein
MLLFACGRKAQKENEGRKEKRREEREFDEFRSRTSFELCTV